MFIRVPDFCSIALKATAYLHLPHHGEQSVASRVGDRFSDRPMRSMKYRSVGHPVGAWPLSTSTLKAPYDAFDYDGVGVAVNCICRPELCVEPHAAPITLYKVVGVLEALVDGRKSLPRSMIMA